VEEQFYLIWPWFALFLPFRLVLWAIVLMIVTGPLSRLLIGAAGWNELATAVATPSVLDAPIGARYPPEKRCEPAGQLGTDAPAQY